MTMTCRAITQLQAEHFETEAAEAGGYVAVGGPRLKLIPRYAYRAIVEDARQLAAAYHELPSGLYARIVSPGHGGYDDYLVLVIPQGHTLARYGYALPPSVVRDLIPLLEAAGYDTAGLLGETSGEAAEVVEA